MRTYILLLVLTVIAFSSCKENRMHEHADWSKFYEAHGIKNACIIIRNNNHETIDYYNKERCLERYMPASTFKIFGSLVALETAAAPDEQWVIKWDSVQRREDCNKDLSLREAFRASCYSYFKAIANKVGEPVLQHWLDTVKYGNMELGEEFDAAWVKDGNLKISADEQLGFVKRLYFNELPFSERSQRIVRSMMLWEDGANYKLSYKTGTGEVGDNYIYWIVGYVERIEKVEEHEKSMNKANFRQYPYFFAQNFEMPKSDTSKDYFKVRVEVLKEVLRAAGALPKN